MSKKSIQLEVLRCPDCPEEKRIKQDFKSEKYLRSHMESCKAVHKKRQLDHSYKKPSNHYYHLYKKRQQPQQRQQQPQQQPQQPQQQQQSESDVEMDNGLVKYGQYFFFYSMNITSQSSFCL